MGRKARGAQLKAKKRALEAAQELVEATAHHVETDHIINQKNLFVLDTTADVVHRNQYEEPARKKQKKGLSTADQIKVRALLEQHSVQELQKLVKESKTAIERAKKQRRTVGNVNPHCDLWGNDADNVGDTATDTKQVISISPGIGPSLAGTAPSHTLVKPRAAQKPPSASLAIQVAHAGQSYHPDKVQHQDVIGEALAMELKRNEVELYQSIPVSQGMSEETKALLITASDDEESSDDDEDDDDANQHQNSVTKRKEKLTKAQRNKLKRHRALQKVLQEQKKSKKMLNQVSNLKQYQKELNRKSTESKQRQTLVAELKQKSQRVLGKDVLQSLSQQHALETPTLPVALSKELQSSLRAVKPKGSMLVDRWTSFGDRKMTDAAVMKDMTMKKKVVQGKRRVKVKGHKKEGKKAIKKEDGSDYLLMA